MFRRLIGIVVRPIMRFVIRFILVSDPWERLDVAPPLRAFGRGARLDFSKYFEGPSSVAVASIGDIQDWLLGCKYESDEALFAEPDFWQHPVTFERLRAGDCEDFALWAWRKLVELNIDADFVTGYCVRDGTLDGAHAWIIFRHEGQEWLFEPARRDKNSMIRPLADVREDYLPQLGVDRTGKGFGFSGYLTSVTRKQRGETRRTA